MFHPMWKLLKGTILAFIGDEALSRGAAMAFYAVTSLGPILLIVIAIAGLVFGHDAAQNAIVAQMTGMMGKGSADMLQTTIQSASGKTSGTLGTIIGIVTLLVTASGVFGEMQSALNAIWKSKPSGTTTSRLIRARAASLGLVAALGFLLIVSLVASAGIAAVGDVITGYLPFGKILLASINILVSYLLISVLFAAIYKVLPDRNLKWQDVIVGAFVTGVLFTAGKTLIGWYLGSSAVASAYGAAGALIIVLLWIYYSSEIFLLGAEFTRQYSLRNEPRKSVAGHAGDRALVAEPRDVRGVATVSDSYNSPVLNIMAVLAVTVLMVRRMRTKS